MGRVRKFPLKDILLQLQGPKGCTNPNIFYNGGLMGDLRLAQKGMNGFIQIQSLFGHSVSLSEPIQCHI